MNRLEEIKRRFELSLSSPIEYGHLMINPEANIEYLIGLLEQAEKDLEELIFAACYYESDITVEMIKKALKAIRGN